MQTEKHYRKVGRRSAVCRAITSRYLNDQGCSLEQAMAARVDSMLTQVNERFIAGEITLGEIPAEIEICRDLPNHA